MDLYRKQFGDLGGLNRKVREGLAKVAKICLRSVPSANLTNNHST